MTKPDCVSNPVPGDCRPGGSRSHCRHYHGLDPCQCPPSDWTVGIDCGGWWTEDWTFRDSMALVIAAMGVVVVDGVVAFGTGP